MQMQLNKENLFRLNQKHFHSNTFWIFNNFLNFTGKFKIKGRMQKTLLFFVIKFEKGLKYDIRMKQEQV